MRNPGRKKLIVWFCLLSCFLVFERGRWPIPCYRWPLPQNYPEYTDWIADHDEVQAYAIAPLEQFHDLEAMLYSTKHFKPMINGWSGFFPPLFHRTKWVMDRFPIPYGIEYLREMGVTHVVFNTDQIYCFHVRNVRKECTEFPALSLVASFDDTLIYQIQPAIPKGNNSD